MLQMNCANCSELIKSPQLAEANVVECPQCSEIVAVKNVVVTDDQESGHASNSLKSLLRSAKTKFQNKKFQNPDLIKHQVTDERLSKKLIRDDFRLKINDDLYGQINFDNNKRFARILNLSYEGAGIEFTERGKLPANNSATQLHLLLPGYEEILSFPAQIVWTNKPAEETINPSITMGLHFRGIDSYAHKCLCGFIWGNSG